MYVSIYNYIQEKNSKIIELLQIKFLFSFLYFYVLLLRNNITKYILSSHIVLLSIIVLNMQQKYPLFFYVFPFFNANNISFCNKIDNFAYSIIIVTIEIGDHKLCLKYDRNLCNIIVFLYTFNLS